MRVLPQICISVFGMALLTAPAWGVDCNGNGVQDGQDIASAYSDDCNDNGIPDECEIPPLQFETRGQEGLVVGEVPRNLVAADFDGDGDIDLLSGGNRSIEPLRALSRIR